MADFCKQCSIDNFGEDTRDFVHQRRAPDGQLLTLHPGEGWAVLCEGCGPTIVDDDGRCVMANCIERHGLYEWHVRVPGYSLAIPFLDDGPPESPVTFEELIKNYSGNADRIIWRTFNPRRYLKGDTGL